MPLLLDKALDEAVVVQPRGDEPGAWRSTGVRGGEGSLTHLLEVAPDFVVVLQVLAIFLW